MTMQIEPRAVLGVENLDELPEPVARWLRASAQEADDLESRASGRKAMQRLTAMVKPLCDARTPVGVMVVLAIYREVEGKHAILQAHGMRYQDDAWWDVWGDTAEGDIVIGWWPRFLTPFLDVSSRYDAEGDARP